MLILRIASMSQAALTERLQLLWRLHWTPGASDCSSTMEYHGLNIRHIHDYSQSSKNLNFNLGFHVVFLCRVDVL